MWPTPKDPELAAVLKLAVDVACEAGQQIMKYWRQGLQVMHKAGNEPVTLADREAQAIIARKLVAAFPTYGFLGEESDEQSLWKNCQRSFVVDPLDGTKEFIAGRENFSVMIGLLDDFSPVVGVIHQPARNRTFVAASGSGAMVIEGENRRQLAVSTTAQVADFRLVMSKSHRCSCVDQIKAALGIANETTLGSAGLKTCAVATGERDVYIDPEGYCRIWDVCAPQVILTEAGGQITDLAGAPLCYNAESSLLEYGLIASNGRCHEALVQAAINVLGPNVKGHRCRSI